jgi:hypothetical protein
MSSALTLVAVTAVLKHLLENGRVEHGVTNQIGGDVAISTLPPDLIATGAEESARLNLFLYQVTPHTGLRAGRRPVLSEPSERSTLLPLALDLHYLLTAYGAHDFHSEILLGFGLQVLHESAVLLRKTVQAALASVSSTEDGRPVPPVAAALAVSDLGEKIEQIKISPQFLSAEETSRLWAALQARYRPSAAYKVSLVMLDRRVPTDTA